MPKFYIRNDGVLVPAQTLPSGDKLLAVPDGQEVCDFCLGGPIRWSYPTRPFRAPAALRHAIGSLGDWAACDACSALIEADDRLALAERSVIAQISGPMAVFFGEARIRAHVTGMMNEFFAHRTGPRETEAEYRKRHGKRGVV